jgi:hypothetical protein
VLDSISLYFIDIHNEMDPKNFNFTIIVLNKIVECILTRIEIVLLFTYAQRDGTPKSKRRCFCYADEFGYLLYPSAGRVSALEVKLPTYTLARVLSTRGSKN